MCTRIIPHALAADADIIAAGAGAIGMLTAWNLHQQGLDVMVLDQQRTLPQWSGHGTSFGATAGRFDRKICAAE